MTAWYERAFLRSPVARRRARCWRRSRMGRRRDVARSALRYVPPWVCSDHFQLARAGSCARISPRPHDRPTVRLDAWARRRDPRGDRLTHSLRLHTALPGVIKEWDATTQTASVLPAVQTSVRDLKGATSSRRCRSSTTCR